MTGAEQGSLPTAVVHGLVGPEPGSNAAIPRAMRGHIGLANGKLA